jgi:HemY protein
VRRRIVFSLAAFFLILGVTVGIYQHLASTGQAGYVIIGLGDWVLETSLYVVLIFVAVLFVSLNLGLFLTWRAARLPDQMKQRNLSQRAKRAEEALVQGFIETLEGKWEKAERTLIRHAGDSTLPLINYLVAARAAHTRGASELREDYLDKARRQNSSADLAIKLLRASLLLESHEEPEALEQLNDINRSHANHPLVLRMLREGYERERDQEALHYLIPSLREAKLYSEADLRGLEVRIYKTLLEKRAVTRDATLLREVWRWVPLHVQLQEEVIEVYCRGMIDAGVGAEVEEPLRLALGREWTTVLFDLYGRIEAEDLQKQFQHVQEWLGPHREDPALYCLLARLAVRVGQESRAIEFAKTSISLKPMPEALKILGDILFNRRDEVAASRLYRQGLRLIRGEAFESESVERALDLLTPPPPAASVSEPPSV